MKTEQFRILYFEDNQLKDNGSRLGTLEMLRADYPNEWLVIPTADLPDDFSVDTYTIVDGSLVRASDEQIAEREAAKKEAMASVEIAELRTYLTATDWVVVKCMEIGESISDHYPELHTARNEARARINKLERGGGYART